MGWNTSLARTSSFAETEEERARCLTPLIRAEAQIKRRWRLPGIFGHGHESADGNSLRGPIDAFFDAVQVNSDNATIRRID